MPELGARVKLSGEGRKCHHARLHEVAGTVRAASDAVFREGKKISAVIIDWDEVIVNSGSMESAKPGGGFSPRKRKASTVVAADHLEAA